MPGFKKNKTDYLKIRQQICLLGHKLSRDWIDEEIKGNKEITVSKMYELTEKAIKESDAVILEYSHNISAVGQQLVLSLQKNIPTLLLIKDSDKVEDSPLSDFFISSNYYKYLKKQKYKKTNLKKIIEDFLKWVELNKSTVRFNLEIERELDEYLKLKAKQNKSSKAEEIRKLVSDDMRRNS